MIFILSAVAAAVVGVEDEQRLNFCNAAKIWPKKATAVMKKRWNSHPACVAACTIVSGHGNNTMLQCC